MKTLLTLLFISVAGFAQKTAETTLNKPVVYLNEMDSVITEKDFRENLDHAINIQGFYETENNIVAKLYTRGNYSSITQTDNAKLREYLSDITNKPNEEDDIIMIHFYTGLQDRVSELSEPYCQRHDKHFVKGINKKVKSKIKHYYVYHHDYDPNDEGAKKNGWYYDKKRLVEYAFFPIHFNYFNVAVIMPDGRTYTHYGEQNPSIIRDGLKILIE